MKNNSTIQCSRAFTLIEWLVVAASLLVPAAPLHAGLKLPAIISHHMVLQQKRTNPVWGWDTPGTRVIVSFAGQTQSAVAGPDGKWSVKLAAVPATHQPQTITISDGTQKIEITDVLVGEVWLCSGQSNMAFTTAESQNGPDDVAQADHPRIRLLQMGNRAGILKNWQICGPATVGKFSAVGYYFGREIEREIDVPVGLIDSSYGRTDAECWISKRTLEASPEFKGVFPALEKNKADHSKAMQEYTNGPLAKWEKAADEAKKAGKPIPAKPREPLRPQTPSGNYSSMIEPLTPYGLRGVIWYQGENNADPIRAEPYRRLLPLLIGDWRGAFGSDLSFYIVQLANCGRDNLQDGKAPWPVVLWAVLRESQAITATTMPQTGLAVAIDIGNPANIHPTNKKEVGHRLALVALAKDYGKSVVFSGPVFKQMTVSGSTATLDFDFATGLAAKGGDLKGFTLAGEDGRFYTANAKISGATVTLSSPAVIKPFAVRYDWLNSPEGNLVNSAGLPAGPFRFPMK